MKELKQKKRWTKLGLLKLRLSSTLLLSGVRANEAVFVWQNSAPFYFCNNFVKPHSLFVTFGSHIPQ